MAHMLLLSVQKSQLTETQNIYSIKFILKTILNKRLEQIN